jgi:hypothetical protein
MTITEFLLARITEDEVVAREAMHVTGDDLTSYQIGEWWEKPEHGRVYAGHWHKVAQAGAALSEPPVFNTAALPHIARHDPARVLAECEAKRQIVARASRSVVRTNSARPSPFGSLSLTEGRYYDGDRDVTDEYYAWHAVDGEPEDPQTLRTLAAVYADHPDFDPAWQPGS